MCWYETIERKCYPSDSTYFLCTCSSLFRWLQPDRAVDAEASVLVLPTEPPVNGLPSEFSVTTRDQDGEKVFVGDMKV